MLPDVLREGLSFDDVLLVPAYSQVLPRNAQVHTQLGPLRLNLPLLSSAMDTVTEAPMAIALARLGGLGVIHKNLTPEDQAAEVAKVKRAQSAVITDPVTIGPDMTLRAATVLMRERGVSGLPVCAGDPPCLIGLLTSRDVRAENDLDRSVHEVMTIFDELVTAQEGVSIEEASLILRKRRLEKLLLVRLNGTLAGLITMRDLLQAEDHPHAVMDGLGRLLVGAAIGPVEDREERTSRLIAAGVDVLVIDTAHGHSRGVIDVVSLTRRDHPGVTIVAGNIATANAARALIDAGAHAIKVGIGPGSICTTRIVAGIGVPQITAVDDCAKVAKGTGTTIISDGGIQYSGDVAKAIAAGADVVMIGSLFAGTDEAPGEQVLYQGRTYKSYRGMGSLAAMRRGSRDRYGQSGVVSEKLVPEGVESLVPTRGSMAQVVDQLIGGLRAAMGYVGCATIPEMQERATFIRMTAAGLRESHPHGVFITQEAPNYARRSST